MALFIDRKFALLASPKLENFKQKNNDLFNLRCPFCGDSKKNKLKSRGYLYRKKNDMFFMCHNCGTSTSFGKFLSFIDPTLFKEYQLERYKNDSHSNTKQPDFSVFKTKPIVQKINLPTIESLPVDHTARKFLENRKLSTDYFTQLYYAKDFSAFIDELIPNHDKNLIKNDERIVIPFYDEKNILLGVQGRTITNSAVRYITVKLDDDNKKVFGLNRVNFNKKIYVVEGPLDSLFLKNCIAMMDASLYNAATIVGKHDFVFVWDNEPRNKEIVRHMNEAINSEKNICIWPQNIKEKDINDMVMAGYSSTQIQEIIDNNTYNGLRAKLQFENWKKI